jgi:hypothetical protein
MEMSNAHMTEAMPTQPSSIRILGTARIIIMSKIKTTAMTRHATCSAFEGVEKNNRTMSKRPSVKVVYEKSKKPEPRECIPGGLTNIDTSNRAHQRKVIMEKKTVKYLKNRTDQRLYGET